MNIIYNCGNNNLDADIDVTGTTEMLLYNDSNSCDSVTVTVTIVTVLTAVVNFYKVQFCSAWNSFLCVGFRKGSFGIVFLVEGSDIYKHMFTTNSL